TYSRRFSEQTSELGNPPPADDDEKNPERGQRERPRQSRISEEEKAPSERRRSDGDRNGELASLGFPTPQEARDSVAGDQGEKEKNERDQERDRVSRSDDEDDSDDAPDGHSGFRRSPESEIKEEENSDARGDGDRGNGRAVPGAEPCAIPEDDRGSGHENPECQQNEKTRNRRRAAAAGGWIRHA